MEGQSDNESEYLASENENPYSILKQKTPKKS